MLRDLVMRFLATFAIVLLASGAAAGTGSPFVCTAEPIVLLEGGPATIRVVLQYRGDRTIKVWSSSLSDQSRSISVAAPKNWGGHGPPKDPSKFSISDIPDGTSNGLAPLLLEVKPGWSFETQVHLGQRFPAIPAGKSRLQVRWEIAVGEESRGETAGTDVELDVPAANPEQIGIVRDRLLDQVRGAKPGTVPGTIALTGITNQLEHCRHIRLLDVLFAILEREREGVANAAAHTAGTMAKANPATRTAIVEYLLRASPHGSVPLINHVLAGPGGQLSATDTRTLSASACVWVRALAWVAGEPADDRLLAVLRALTAPVRANKLQQLVDRLDSSVFRTREQASEELAGLKEAAIPFLQDALKRPLSREQREHIETIIAAHKKQPVDPVGLGVIRHLGSLDTRQARLVLKALTENDPGSWITKEARAALIPAGTPPPAKADRIR